MKKTLIAMTAALALTGCNAGDPDGEGANVVEDATDGTEQTTEEETTGEDATDEQAQGTRSNPLPIGTTAQIGDWQVTVTDIELDATETVQAQNEFNEPPAEGRQFVMATVEATYVGEDSGEFWLDMGYQFVGSGGNTFGTSMDDMCGVIPNDMQEQGETFPDGSVTGNICFSVPSDQVKGGAIAMESSFSIDSDRVFFAVQ